MRKVRYLLLPLLIVANVYGQSKVVTQPLLGNRMSILHDKAYISLPEGSRYTDTNYYTTIKLETDSLWLLVSAEDEFAICNDLFKDSPIEKGTEKIKITIQDSTHAVLYRAKKPKHAENVIVVSKILIKAKDNSVFCVKGYIRPENMNRWKEYQAIYQRIFSTITNGDKNLKLNARMETVPIPLINKNFIIALPENYVWSSRNKPDEIYESFEMYRNLSEEGWADLYISIKKDPEYIYEQEHLEKDSLKITTGTFLGKPIDWLEILEWTHGYYVKEQIIPLESKPGWKMHVFMRTSKEKYIEDLTKIVENITWSDK